MKESKIDLADIVAQQYLTPLKINDKNYSSYKYKENNDDFILKDHKIVKKTSNLEVVK